MLVFIHTWALECAAAIVEMPLPAYAHRVTVVAARAAAKNSIERTKRKKRPCEGARMRTCTKLKTCDFVGHKIPLRDAHM